MIAQPLAEAVDRFHRLELAGGLFAVPERPVLAAIGTLAPRALNSPLLRDRLTEAGIEPAETRSYGEPVALLADTTWTLCLVLSPFKRKLPRHCDALAPAAAKTGVVDTLLRQDGGVLGLNTNAYAAAGAIRALVGGSPPERVLLVGSGASTRSVAAGLRSLYPSAEVGVIARSPARAAAVASELGLSGTVGEAGSFGADLVVNTTTVGETDDLATLEIDVAPSLRPGVRFFDLNNRPSALQTAALQAGCVTLSGVTMQIITNAIRVSLLRGV